MRRLLLATFFFEIGFVLIVVPWSTFWDRNYFAQSASALEALVTNNFLRGAVSGLGLVNLLAGLAEVVSMILARPADRPASIKSSRLAED